MLKSCQSEASLIINDNLPLISIIVLNHNGKIHLNRCLSSLGRTNYPSNRFEVLFIDNCSQDNSTDFVAKNFPWVKMINFKKNYGFSEGNNRSIRYSIGDYVVFLNNDTEVSPNWLLNLVLASRKHAAEICCSKTIFMSNMNLVHFCGGKLVVNGRGSSNAFFTKNSILDLDFYTGYPCAASMLIKKSVFLKLGGFDPDYFACLDDTDLGWRAWLMGYRVLCCPSSIVYHAVGGTTGMARISPMRAFQGTKNSITNVLKNLEMRTIPEGLLLAFGFDLVELFYSLKKRQSVYFRIKCKGYLWVLKNLKQIVHKRHNIQKNRLISDKWLFQHGLLCSLIDAITEYYRLNKTGSWN